MNQPNLQAILLRFAQQLRAIDLQRLREKITIAEESEQRVTRHTEAIDAIYAGIKRDVLGEQITDNQAIALKRWCYGDTK